MNGSDLDGGSFFTHRNLATGHNVFVQIFFSGLKVTFLAKPSWPWPEEWLSQDARCSPIIANRQLTPTDYLNWRLSIYDATDTELELIYCIPLSWSLVLISWFMICEFRLISSMPEQWHVNDTWRMPDSSDRLTGTFFDKQTDRQTNKHKRTGHGHSHMS